VAAVHGSAISGRKETTKVTFTYFVTANAMLVALYGIGQSSWSMVGRSDRSSRMVHIRCFVNPRRDRIRRCPAWAGGEVRRQKKKKGRCRDCAHIVACVSTSQSPAAGACRRDFRRRPDVLNRSRSDARDDSMPGAAGSSRALAFRAKASSLAGFRAPADDAEHAPRPWPGCWCVRATARNYVLKKRMGCMRPVVGLASLAR